MDFAKIIACLKAFGLEKPSVDIFEHRLIFQKVIYLLQLKGVKTGFPFSLYARGPYSPDLTRYLYGHKTEVALLRTSAHLGSNELEAVTELKDLVGTSTELLEVAATYAYFAYEQRMDTTTALKNVRRLKPFYSEAQIAVGVSRAKEYLFNPTMDDLAELKKELGPWQHASVMDEGAYEKRRDMAR